MVAINFDLTGGNLYLQRVIKCMSVTAAVAWEINFSQHKWINLTIKYTHGVLQDIK